jgi:uncharacterized protein with FMN-binding domain
MTTGKAFVSRAVSCLIIVAALFYYNQIMTLNGEIEMANAQIEKANTQIEKANIQIEKMAAAQAMNITDAPVPLAAPEGKYNDGTYRGTAQGYGGPVTTQITVEGGDVVGIEITSADREDAAYYNMCLGILDEILEEQGADVDTVSGATLTSLGIIDSAREALSQAEK